MAANLVSPGVKVKGRPNSRKNDGINDQVGAIAGAPFEET